jgi:hypothetical protein
MSSVVVLWYRLPTKSSAYFVAGSLPSHNWFSTADFQLTSESELFYDWRFTANQFVLAPSCFRSKSHYDRLSVSQSALVSSPIRGPRPYFCYCQTFAVLSASLLTRVFSSARTAQKTASIGSSIACVYVVAETCLSIRCLATDNVTTSHY